MIEQNDKQYLYWLIDQYLSNTINAWTFCGLFHESYGLSIDSDSLNPLENAVFNNFRNVAARYSPYEDDLKKYPGVYYSEQELRNEVIKVKAALCNVK